MDSRRFAFLLVALGLVFGGLWALVALERKHALGRYAGESPQRLEVKVGHKVIVGGGRAVLWVASELPNDLGGERFEVEVSCRGERRRATLTVIEDRLEACGVVARVADAWGGRDEGDPRLAYVEVIWDSWGR